MKKKASFVRILGALGVCFGVVAASFSPLLALADPDHAVGYGDIYIGYVEPGVWQVRNSAGVAVKTVTVTTPGPVWFTQNQELPVGTYTIHLLQTGDYVNIDPTPAATVEVIDTDGRVPAGIGQVSDPRWKEVLREYKGLPSLPFFYAVKQNLQYCGSECGVWEALLDLWNEKKAALTPEDLLAVPDFVAYLDLFGSPSTDEERKDMAFFYLTTGWFFGPSGFLGAVLSYGIPAADPILDENPRGAYERYYRYRIVQAGNTVDEELLSWRLDCQFDVCDWDAYGEDDFRALLGDLTPDNYRAMIENRIENADWASVVFLVNDCADT
ncbi:MAG: hypothetical protein IKZ87_07945, partial [Actinomycetaceae bacterium]|nr:hypothetical protein [Actinomycetaceae bacterium]